MDNVTKRMSELRIIPMIRTIPVSQASALGRALLASGLAIANISQQTPEGLEVLRLLAAQYPDLLVGAGNVQTEEEARNAIEAGAQFIFSPLFDEQVINLCRQQEVTVYPVTTDGALAMEYHFEVLGFYPVEKLGGLPAVSALGQRFPLRFIVAGGIKEQTLAQYLRNPHVVAALGSWMIDPVLASIGDWRSITEACRKVHQLATAIPSAL
jgi:2-dehydro-3-deoxyphosphogluconate aldolase / (4S)-4-hydroxy-2-oxoglutarate aldolase